MSNSGASFPVLLLGSARSGTTLMQRMLNSYDDVIIWGEHDAFLSNIAESYFQLVQSESMEEFSFPQSKGNSVSLSIYKEPGQWQAWNNWFGEDDLKGIYHEFLKSFFVSDWTNEIRIWGFKEVRYGGGDRVVELFKAIFPDVKIIIMFRDPVNVIDSQLMAFNNIGGRLRKVRKLFMLPTIYRMAKHWNLMNEGFIEYFEIFPDSILVVAYEDFIGSENEAQRVFSFVDLYFGESQRDVLNMKSGRGSAYTESGRAGTSDRWRELGLIPALLVKLVTNRVYKRLKTRFSKESNL